MKKQYLIDNKDLRRIKQMIKLVDRAIIEIIAIKELKTEKPDTLGSGQSDLIEEEWFARQQMNLFEDTDPSIYE